MESDRLVRPTDVNKEWRVRRNGQRPRSKAAKTDGQAEGETLGEAFPLESTYLERPDCSAPASRQIAGRPGPCGVSAVGRRDRIPGDRTAGVDRRGYLRRFSRGRVLPRRKECLLARWRFRRIGRTPGEITKDGRDQS